MNVPRLSVALLLLSVPIACSHTPTQPSEFTATFVGAGDIADCGPGAAATAALLDGIGGTVFTAGDNAYDTGSADEFSRCYEPTWGRHKARTRPAPGNHDYATAGAAGYFGYFGDRAGPAGLGYYSFDLGAWHIVSLNSNVAAGTGSAQLAWLRSDLAANARACTLAYWHHPVFSSSLHGNDATMVAVWQALYDARADVVISGHDHDYERFAPQDVNGAAAPARGIREFVVGTGGHSTLYPAVGLRPNSEAQSSRTFGVLVLTLHPTGYDWEFRPVAGGSFSDSGAASCVI